MKPSKQCLDLIKKFEGLKLEAYQCEAGKWTIGYGTTRYWHGESVKKGHKISKESAELELSKYVDNIAKTVDSLLPDVLLNQDQFDAVVSLVYNIGASNFQDSTLRNYLLIGNFEKSADEFEKWVYFTDPTTKEKKVSDGLVNRRKKERELFISL